MKKDLHQGEADVKRHLQRVIESPQFRDSPQLQGFLEYVVAEVLANRGAEISAYDVGTKALGRGETFAPDQDPIVRVVASNLRKRLDLYYAKDGANEPYRFYLPRGRYDPILKSTNGAETAAPPFRLKALLTKVSKTHAALLILVMFFAGLFAWERIAHHGGDAFRFQGHENLATSSKPAVIFHRPRINVSDESQKVQAETIVSSLVDLLTKSESINVFEIENHDDIKLIKNSLIFHIHFEINADKNKNILFIRLNDVNDNKVIFSSKSTINNINELEKISKEILDQFE